MPAVQAAIVERRESSATSSGRREYEAQDGRPHDLARPDLRKGLPRAAPVLGGTAEVRSLRSTRSPIKLIKAGSSVRRDPERGVRRWIAPPARLA